MSFTFFLKNQADSKALPHAESYREETVSYKYISSVQSANLANFHLTGQANMPIGRLVSPFANCAAQSANYPGICLICKLCQPMSFHNMKVSNVGRQQSEILTIVISVNIFHGRRLLVMLVSCHNLCRISSFVTRYFSRSHYFELK